jgi:sugar lactone lactonase YvrE
MRVGGIALGAENAIVVALSDGIYDFDPRNSALTLKARSPFPSHVHLHECGCDRAGRLWVGGFDSRLMTNSAAADGFYSRLDGNMLTPLIPGIQCANGLAFSPDGCSMYAANSPGRDIRKYLLDPRTGNLGPGVLFATVEAGYGYIDGATVDAAGGYWVAIVGRGVLRRYHPDGSVDREIQVPCLNPTKPAFGGPNLQTLFVTSTRMRIDAREPRPADGRIFAITPGEQGLPEPRIAQA